MIVIGSILTNRGIATVLVIVTQVLLVSNRSNTLLAIPYPTSSTQAQCVELSTATRPKPPGTPTGFSVSNSCDHEARLGTEARPKYSAPIFLDEHIWLPQSCRESVWAMKTTIKPPPKTYHFKNGNQQCGDEATCFPAT